MLNTGNRAEFRHFAIELATFLRRIIREEVSVDLRVVNGRGILAEPNRIDARKALRTDKQLNLGTKARLIGFYANQVAPCA